MRDLGCLLYDCSLKTEKINMNPVLTDTWVQIRRLKNSNPCKTRKRLGEAVMHLTDDSNCIWLRGESSIDWMQACACLGLHYS